MIQTTILEQVKKLIQGSASLSNEDKKKIIQKLPELSFEELGETVKVFEEEIEDWKEIYNENQENKSMLLNFMNQSQHDLSVMSHNLVGKAEKSKHLDEEVQAENLLKTLS